MDASKIAEFNDEHALIRSSLEEYFLARNRALEETRSLKVKTSVIRQTIGSLEIELNEARKRLDTFLERGKFLRRDLLQRVSSHAEVPELKLRYQSLVDTLDKLKEEKRIALQEIKEKQVALLRENEELFDRKVERNREELEKIMKETNDLHLEYCGLKEDEPLRRQEKAFAEELKLLEVEMGSEAKGAEVFSHEACQRRENELIAYKQKLEKSIQELRKSR